MVSSTTNVPSTSDAANRRVVVTGSSGLIGTALVTTLERRGHPVTRLVRSQPGPNRALWDPKAGTIDAEAIDGAWAVVHLAGEGIADKKWTAGHKAAVLDSRVKGTTLLATTLSKLKTKPAVFACGSAVGFYGSRGDEVMSEESSSGTGFLAEVVRAWEQAASPALDAGIPTAFLRTGLVLSTRGGALKTQLLPFKFGLGGRLGNGKQYLPWITLTDEVAAIVHVLDTDTLRGPVNLSAPNPVTNETFTKALGRAVKRPTLIPVPLLPLKLRFGAEMVREMALSSTRMVPTKLQQTGFQFTHPELGPALEALLSQDL